MKKKALVVMIMLIVLFCTSLACVANAMSSGQTLYYDENNDLYVAIDDYTQSFLFLKPASTGNSGSAAVNIAVFVLFVLLDVAINILMDRIKEKIEAKKRRPVRHLFDPDEWPDDLEDEEEEETEHRSHTVTRCDLDEKLGRSKKTEDNSCENEAGGSFDAVLAKFKANMAKDATIEPGASAVGPDNDHRDEEDL